MTNSKVSLKLPVGLEQNSGLLLSINDVERGLNCNCICPGCKTALVARKGEHKTHHFAHHTPPPDNKINCAESALHKWAKKIVSQQTSWYLLPEHFVPREWTTVLGEKLVSHDEWWSPFQREPVCITSAVEEYDFGDWKPDVLLIGKFNGAEVKIAIEIMVSHPVDDEKLDKVRRKDIDLLEIELSPSLILDGNLTESELEDKILDHSNQLWLHTPLAERLKRKHDSEFEELIAEPKLQKRREEVEAFTNSLIGKAFTVPECHLYEFPDDIRPETFSFFANGKSVNVAAGKELISPARNFVVTDVEMLADRARLHLLVSQDRTHPIDLVFKTDKSERDKKNNPEQKTSTLILTVDHDSPADSWLQSARIEWLFSRRREETINSLRQALRVEKQAQIHRERYATRQRTETAKRLTNQILNLKDQFEHSEPEWSRSYAARFIDARELARSLGEGPFGGHGLIDRTHNDWIFGVPGQQWKTILAAEMIKHPDHDDLIKFNSLKFFLRKHRLTMHNALSSLWKLDEGREVFEQTTMLQGRTVELPTVSSALHHWLSHLSKVQPNLIMQTGRFKRGFRWISGQRERIAKEFQAAADNDDNLDC